MDLPDVNILVGAHRVEHPQHAALREWLNNLVNGDAAFGMSSLVVSGFLRVVTNPRVFREPTPMQTALAFADAVLSPPQCVQVRPGPGHYKVFRRLCDEPGIRGNLVPDAYFAALAIETGCRWVTRDRDFARFEGLVWMDPLAGGSIEG